jgi:large subunit ribosomal protein L9
MSNRIRVILLEDITDVGNAGDIVTVTEGFARNALFPSGRAALATEKHMARAEQQKQSAKRTEEIELKQRQAQAEAIEGTELTIAARAKDEQDIFGTITSAIVAKELAKANIAAAPGDIKLPKKITKLGTYEVVVSLGNGIEATIHLNVIPDATSQEKKD